MRFHRAAAGLAAAALFSSIAPAIAGATVSTEGKIVFAANNGVSFDLWVVNADGTLATQLTHTPAVDELDPAWSPDGTRIAFTAKPDWKDGSEIWLMDEDGTDLQRLTDDFSPQDRQPAWSPDGGRLAWVRSLPGLRNSELWSMRADGGDRRPVLRPSAGRFVGSPDWSPGGQWIAFVSNLQGGFPDLWTIGAGGSGARQVTATAQMEGNPSWSPDGGSIAFERRTVPGTAQIWAVDPAGSEERMLTSGPTVKEQPVWSPDGATVAYVASPWGGGDKDIEAAAVDGLDIMPMAATNGADVSPDWTTRSVDQVLASRSAPVAAAAPPSTATGPERMGKAVGSGLTLLKGRFRKSDYWALRFNPAKPSTLDVALATDVLPGRETVSNMAKRHGAIAAINGDFPTPSGAPIHPFAQDGDLKKTGFHVSHNFAPSMDEDTMYLDRPIDSVSVAEGATGDLWTVDQWNDGAPAFGDAAAFTMAGGAEGAPPPFTCSVRLVDPSPALMAPEGIMRDYTVNAVVCRVKRLARAGGVVLSARPGTVAALMISSLVVGETVSLTWWFQHWPEVADSLGGWPPLLHQGERRVEPCSESICFRHPRAGVGVTATGKVLLVVVDGRRKGSKGLTLVQFAKLFRLVGATSALNLDGGGTAEMWLRGKVMNNPSDGHERPTASAILVLPGEDPGESILPAGASGTASTDGAAGRASVLDPASTGGLLDAMAGGLFGPRRLPARWRDDLLEFRAHEAAAPG